MGGGGGGGSSSGCESAGAEAMGDDPVERVADVATEAARIVSRPARRLVREEIQLAHPMMSARRLREATEQAVIWRTADIVAPMYLTDQQRNWARHGLDE